MSLVALGLSGRGVSLLVLLLVPLLKAVLTGLSFFGSLDAARLLAGFSLGFGLQTAGGLLLGGSSLGLLGKAEETKCGDSDDTKDEFLHDGF
jgi:hypothetical protein